MLYFFHGGALGAAERESKMAKTETKYQGGTSPGAGESVTLDRHPKVLDYDSYGTDDGVRIVTLIRGWAFEDAAENEGDDPEGNRALHSAGCSSVKDALEQIRYAKPCKCGRCLGNY